jgi:sortase (surface protein transpeptidase)
MTTLALSLVTFVVVPAWWAVARPRVDAGSVPPVDAAPVPTSPVDTDAREVPDIPVSSARLADRWEPAGPRPVRVRIPAIDVDAAILPVGVDVTSGGVQVPTDISQVGWYRYGPLPGRPGSSLLVGHVDSAALGAGVFFRLGKVPLGSLLSIDFGDGSTLRFRVVARRAYPKSELPGRLFARSGDPVVTLVTCGGAFDPSTGHYRENVVVYAVPLSR